MLQRGCINHATFVNNMRSMTSPSYIHLTIPPFVSVYLDIYVRTYIPSLHLHAFTTYWLYNTNYLFMIHRWIHLIPRISCPSYIMFKIYGLFQQFFAGFGCILCIYTYEKSTFDFFFFFFEDIYIWFLRSSFLLFRHCASHL